MTPQHQPARFEVMEDAAAPTLDALARLGLRRLVPPAMHDHEDFASLGRASLAGAPAAALFPLARALPAEPERALVRLADALDLTDAELLASRLLLEVETDPALSFAVSRLQGGTDRPGPARPTTGLLARAAASLGLAASSTAPVAAIAAGRAVAAGLFRPASATGDEPLADRQFALAAAPLTALLNADGCAPGFTTPTPPSWCWPASWSEAAEALLPVIAASTPVTLVIRAADVAEAKGAAAALAARAGRATAVARPAPSWSEGCEPWLIVTGAVPVLAADLAPGETLAVPAFAHYRGALIIAAGRDGAVAAEHGPVRVWRPSPPTPAERAALWAAALGPDHAHLAADLATRLRCGVRTLHAIADAARVEPAITTDALRAAAAENAAEAAQSLGGLARLATDEVPDEAFIAPPPVARRLSLLLARARVRETIADTLGPATRARAAPGVKALLTGPSGTGKTLAARWLAGRLGKPLLLVDAGAVSSKYIGETEKHLGLLFARAEDMDGVLLFDEADSLFGARTAVTHSTDRFANAQTNYLLQRLETFEGVALLTSNSKERFDGAFMRRLDAVIEFPLPGAAERCALWLAHIGEAHAARIPRHHIAALAAEADLPGGHIRGAVLTAAALAAEQARPLDLGGLRAGAAAEYEKLGRRSTGAFADPRPPAMSGGNDDRC